MRLADQKIGIVGLGQMGGSIAGTLADKISAANLVGFDNRSELSKSALDRKYIGKSASSIEELIEGVDVVILALPVLEIAKFLKERSTVLAGKALVTDTGSLKTEIAKTANAAGLVNFIGGHPLAGSELKGVESWNSQLFRNANYFVTYSDANTEDAKGLMSQLIKALGASEVAVTATEHDRMFATSSNLPHLFAYVLRTQFEGENGVDPHLFECPSYRGSTRVAASDAEMVFQMLWGNRKNLAASLMELRFALFRAQKALDSGDESGFRKILGGVARK